MVTHVLDSVKNTYIWFFVKNITKINKNKYIKHLILHLKLEHFELIRKYYSKIYLTEFPIK
jgi:hypothetical protein